MKLSNKRFFHNSLRIDGLPAERYGYETYRAIYDIDIFDGEKHYRKNCVPSEMETIHEKIEEHFSI